MYLGGNKIKDSAMQDILVESFRSTKVMAQVFFEERFFAPFSGLHDQMFDLIDSDEPRVVIAAPRGIGKTSMVALALAAKKILFQDSRFLPYVNMSHDAAVLQTENLKLELSSNALVRKMFGQVNTTSGEFLDKTFSKKSWVARFQEDNIGTLVYPRGSGQQIRGLLYRNARPDFFIVDDLEDPETIENEDQRRKRKEWFFADLMKAVSRVDKRWRIVYIDTLKHEDSLLQTLLDSSDWASLKLEICNDELESLAPEFISTEEIRAEHKSHKEKGLLDVFYREFRNIPISLEDAVFKSEQFKYFVEAGDKILIYEPGKTEPDVVYPRNLTTMVIVDPAKTVKLQSADSAVVTVSIDRSSKRILVRNIVSDKFMPDALLDAMFREVLTYKAMILAVEVTSLHAWVSQPIENEMRVRGIYPMYMEMHANDNTKAARVAALAPYYKLGYIYHNKANCTKLESQLIGFPRSKLWDVMDAFGYLPKVLDEHACYFDPDDLDDEEVEDKEYADLEEDNEVPIRFAWV